MFSIVSPYLRRCSFAPLCPDELTQAIANRRSNAIVTSVALPQRECPFETDALRVDRFVGFEVVERAARAPRERDERPPVVQLSRLSLVELRGHRGGRLRTYILAIAGPAIFVASLILTDHVTGLGRFISSRPLAVTVSLVLIVNGALGMFLTLGEEYGWRGYLLPHLLPLGEVRATLTLAAIWAVWRSWYSGPI